MEFIFSQLNIYHKTDFVCRSKPRNFTELRALKHRIFAQKTVVPSDLITLFNTSIVTF